MRALIIRGAQALARPLAYSEACPIPLVSEVEPFMTLIEFSDYGGTIRVIRASTGEAPTGWRWLNIGDLQAEMPDDEATVVGEALLCA